MTYHVELTGAADRQLAKLPLVLQRRVVQRLDALAENPRPLGATTLQGGEGLLRIRVGDYRVIYRVHDDVLLVLVVRIGHRREVYRRL